jgi:antitoxin component of RelBE/YafQ-DinJ toxin-antitoxin module
MRLRPDICITAYLENPVTVTAKMGRVQHRFDDEVKNRAQDAFTPEMMKLPQSTWMETFLEGVIDLNT